MESMNIDKRPLYSSRIIKTYMAFIKQKFSYINIGELLSHAKMEPYQVEDEGHWFTQEQVDLFYEKLEKLTGNKTIAREAGRYAASPETIGMMRHYALGLMGPAKVFEIVGKVASNFTKSETYDSKKLGSNRVEIIVTPLEDVNEKPFQCENRMGFFEAVSALYNYKFPKIEHTECIFKGGKSCCYTVSWREFQSVFWNKLRNYTALFLLSICLAYHFLLPHFTQFTTIISSITIVLILSWYAGFLEKKELKSAIDHLKGSSDKLFEQINLN